MIGAWFDRRDSRNGRLTLLQLLLLWLTLTCASFGLAAVIEHVPFMFFPLLASISLLTAWGVSHLRLSKWGFALTGAALGMFGITLTSGGIGGTLIGLASSLFAAPSLMVPDVARDLSNLIPAWLAFHDALEILTTRFSNWSQAISNGRLIVDPMVISILWGTVFWLTVFWSLWWIKKRTHVLVGMLPTITLLGWNVYYTHSSAGIIWLIFTIGGVLALQASTSYEKARQRWTARRITRGNIEQGLIFSVMLVSGVMVILANILPSVPVKKIAKLVDDIFEQPADPSLARSLGLEQTPAPDPLSELRPTPTRTAVVGSQLPSFHIIGPGSIPEQDTVMFVVVDEYSPPPIDEFATIHIQNSAPYYWRSQTYMNFNGHTWSTGDTSTREFDANQFIPVNAEALFAQTRFSSVTQHVMRLRAEDSTVFVSGELLHIDQPSRAVTHKTGEVISAYTESSSYTAHSRINTPNVEALRAAGSDYSAAVLPYLQLPDDLPPRVRDLALTLTADQDTPFDKALMLEEYLRQFPYSLDVPAPPLGRDAVDYFLFDLKQGYCDYYATAMIVMARATGLPARLVLGYSQGVYDRTEERFVVRDSNAHAWVEVYFPEIGWVEFEPTPSRPNIFRSGQSPENSQQLSEMLPPGEEAPLSIHLGYSWQGRTILILLVSMAVVLLILSLPLEAWWLSLLPAEQRLDTIMHRLYRRGQALGIEPKPSRTPNDFTHALAEKAAPRILEGELPSVTTTLENDLKELTNLYNRLLFSKHPPSRKEMKAAIHTWTRIRRGMKQIRKKISPDK